MLFLVQNCANTFIPQCLQIRCSGSGMCWIARIPVYFGLEVTKLTAFLLKSHHELIKFAEVIETKPAALMSSF